MTAYFERFEITMTLSNAKSASHPGDCEDDVRFLMKLPSIARKLKSLSAEDVRSELKEYGAWDAKDLADHDANLMRITWIAACNIREQHATK